MSFRDEITPYTSPDPNQRRDWRLESAQVLACEYHRNFKAYLRHYMKIQLPQLTGLARTFNKATLWAYGYNQYTGYTSSFSWFYNINPFVAWTTSSTWEQIYAGSVGNNEDMIHTQHDFASPSAFAPGWYAFPMGGVRPEGDYPAPTGIKKIYEDNSYSACQCTIQGGILPNDGWNPADCALKFDTFTVLENRWDPNTDQAYYGHKIIGWTNELLPAYTLFIHFEYSPPQVGGGYPERMFWKGEWGGTAQGLN